MADTPTVEQIVEVLAGHRYGYTSDEHGWEWAACQDCPWPNGKRIARGPGYDAHRMHVAEQVVAYWKGETHEDVR